MDEEKIVQRARRAVAEKVFPGCVIGLIQLNKQIVMSVGTLDGNVPTQENTIYDVASITKSIPTASLALMFIAQGKLSLEDPVNKYLSELRNDYGATIEDLLRYRVKGPRMSQLKFKTFEEIRTHIFEHGFDESPSEKHAFTNLPAFLLGIIIERVDGEILPALAHRYFFEPLKMNDTTFFLASPDQDASPHNFSYRRNCVGDTHLIAPTEIVDGEEIRGIVHDESARLFARARRAVGHAGLFSTAPDLLNFLEAFLKKGFRKPLLEGAQKGLGWQIDEPWMGERRSEQTFGKTGFTGTSIVVDIERGIGLVILANRTYPKRPPDTAAINAFRQDVADIVFG